MTQERLIKDKDTQAVIKHFERSFYSEDGKLLYKLVSEFARYSPTDRKRLYILENILPETVFYNSEGGEYHLSAARGECDEITSNAYVTGRSKVTSDEGFTFQTRSANYLGEENVLKSDERFRISGPGMEVDGLGFEINLNNRTLEIKKTVKTSIAADKKLMELDDVKSIPGLLKGGEGEKQRLYIESNRLKYDDNSSVISYEDDVQLTYGDFIVRSDKMDILMDKERKKIKRIDLEGDVFIESPFDGFKGYCDKVSYDIYKKQTTFYGEPKIWRFIKKNADASFEESRNSREITFEIPFVKRRLPYYPILQRSIIKFNPMLLSRTSPEFDILLRDTLMQVADMTLSGSTMTHSPDLFEVREDVHLTYSLAGGDSPATAVTARRI